MKLQYIENEKGKPAGVFIPIKEWNALKSKNKDVAALELNNSGKTQLIQELKDAIKELTAISSGKKKSRPVKALLDEL